MEYASSAHAASAGSYEFATYSLSRLRERAGVRGIQLLPPLGEGKDGGFVVACWGGVLVVRKEVGSRPDSRLTFFCFAKRK